MPNRILSGADFGVGFPQGGGQANNNFSSNLAAQLLGQGFQQQQEQQVFERNQAAQAQKAELITQAEGEQKRLTGLFTQIERIKSLPFQSQKKEIALLGQSELQAGRDGSEFIEALNANTPDELNLNISRLSTKAGNLAGQFDEVLKANKPIKTKDQFEPIFQNGEIVAQRNTATNKVEADPRARSSLAKGAGGKFFQPVTLVNKKTGEKRLALPVGDPTTQTASLADIDVPEGFEVSVETPQEERAASALSKVAVAGDQVTAKGVAKRREDSIATGLEAADGFANIQRGIELLEEVPTGGVDNLALKASQFFGIEGADEAELSNRLGKAVLSQLRATFGAAFTAKEGASLAEIEAGFGKSTEGNRRLLQQAKRIVLRVAKRGIKAAKAAGDEQSAQDIQDALDFRLGTELQPSAIDTGFTQEQIQSMTPEQRKELRDRLISQ